MGMYIVKNSSSCPLEIYVLYYMLNYTTFLKSKKTKPTQNNTQTPDCGVRKMGAVRGEREKSAMKSRWVTALLWWSSLCLSNSAWQISE